MNSSRFFRALVIAIPWLLVLSVLAWLFTIRYPASGRVSFSHAFDGGSPWFTPFQPGERVTSPGNQPDGWRGQRILAEPVYASARVPGVYDLIEVVFEARAIRQPLVEIGVLRDPEAFAFEMRPLWSSVLQEGWREVRIGNVRGFVRDDQPDQALVTDDIEKIMTWHATTSAPLWSDVSQGAKTYEISLRGQHDFHVVPVDGEIRFDFMLQDMNRSREGRNLAAFRLVKDGELLWTDAVTVSGISDQRPSVPFEKNIRIRDLGPGVYRLSFVADDDLFIREITTTAQRWVMGPRIYFGDRVGYRATSTAVTAWTNSLHAAADTFHAEGLQEISFGSSKARLRETHTPYALERAPEERSGAVRVFMPSGNVRFIADGYFALEEDALFLPYPRRLTADSRPAEEGIVAILTPYQKPERIADGWYRLKARFPLVQDDAHVRFSLAAPGMESRGGAFDIRAFSVSYSRPPLTLAQWLESLRREIRASLKRL